MDKELLRRLGWSEELIATAEAARRPIRKLPFTASTRALSVSSGATIGVTTLDLSGAPSVACTTVPTKPTR